MTKMKIFGWQLHLWTFKTPILANLKKQKYYKFVVKWSEKNITLSDIGLA